MLCGFEVLNLRWLGSLLYFVITIPRTHRRQHCQPERLKDLTCLLSPGIHRQWQQNVALCVDLNVTPCHHGPQPHLSICWLPSTNVAGQPFYMNEYRVMDLASSTEILPFFLQVSPWPLHSCVHWNSLVLLSKSSILSMVSFSNSELVIYYNMFQIKGEQY